MFISATYYVIESSVFLLVFVFFAKPLLLNLDPGLFLQKIKFRITTDPTHCGGKDNDCRQVACWLVLCDNIKNTVKVRWNSIEVLNECSHGREIVVSRSLTALLELFLLYTLSTCMLNSVVMTVIDNVMECKL